MNPTWIFLIPCIHVCGSALPVEQVKSFVKLTELGYEDACSKSSRIEWRFVTDPTEETRRLWENAAVEYASYKEEQVNETRRLTNETFDDAALEYTYNVVTKPGDALLDSYDYDKLVSFVAQAETIRLTGFVTTGRKKHFRQEVERQLARGGASDRDKLASWSAWHRRLAATLAANFSENLQLVEKAAIANGQRDTTEYWEMLSDCRNGYELAKSEWSKLSSLHNKILKFVKNRLAMKYGDEIGNDRLPAHLLGSLRGYEWTNLAMDVTLYNDVTYNIRKSLYEKELIGETLYKDASALGNIVLKHVPQADFWKESQFRGQCPSHLINLCKYGKMRISTCSEASIESFVSAHKNVAKILVSQMSQDSDTILSVANRYSALEEGVAELFGILSFSHAWLKSRGLINETTNSEQVRMVSLMITALDVLPRMAYYLAADAWRIDTLRNKTTDVNEISSTWWKYRNEYQGIASSESELPAFLDDDYITGNKPYLSKFMGTMLAFQIYEYLMESTDVRSESIIETSTNHQHLMKAIRQGFAEDWATVIAKYLDIHRVNADTMLSYFSTLEDFMDENEEALKEFLIPSDQEKNLNQLEDRYRKKFNEPPTTTTTTASPNPRESKTSGEYVKSKGLEAPKSLTWDKLSSINATTTWRSVEIRPANKSKENTIQMNSGPSEGSADSSEKIKPNTSKAVWAVAAVLMATVAICIIAIFGRRRCRKTPKNRRYV